MLGSHYRMLCLQAKLRLEVLVWGPLQPMNTIVMMLFKSSHPTLGSVVERFLFASQSRTNMTRVH
jgi:hypothetical protein